MMLEQFKKTIRNTICHFMIGMIGVSIGAFAMYFISVKQELLRYFINSDLVIGMVGAIIGAIATYIFSVREENKKIKISAFVALQDLSYFLSLFSKELKTWGHYDLRSNHNQGKSLNIDNPDLDFPTIDIDNVSQKLNAFVMLVCEKIEAQKKKEEIIKNIIILNDKKKNIIQIVSSLNKKIQLLEQSESLSRSINTQYIHKNAIEDRHSSVSNFLNSQIEPNESNIKECNELIRKIEINIDSFNLKYLNNKLLVSHFNLTDEPSK